MKLFKHYFFFLALFLAIGACTKSNKSANQEGGLSGSVLADGSSTVFPITEAMAEEFRAKAPGVRVTVGMSGTGGGFKKFVVGEVDINNASRHIKGIEIEKAKENGVEYAEIPVAFDGITILVNPQNDWVDYLTVEELKKIWDRDSKVVNWSDVRATWPKEAIKLYGPGTDSGTFDYFTEAINGKSGQSRSDYTMSEDDNVLVRGVSGDKNALGYFGFSYYEENKTLVKAVPVKGAKDVAVLPSLESINTGTYEPLSRPVFIYVSKKSLETKPQVKEFVRFYLETAPSIVKEVGYVPLPQETYATHLSSEYLKANAR